jgi:predicted nucleic acid-binding protein
MIYFLDTSLVVYVLRQKGNWRDVLINAAQKGPLGISIIALSELMFGTLLANDPAKERKRIADFIEDLGVEIFYLTPKTAEFYARSRYDLERKGERLDHMDLFVAAVTLENDGTLVTGDREHFERIPGLKIYNQTRP